MVKETLRWCPVTPLAFPHRAEEEDDYKGFKVCIVLRVKDRLYPLHHTDTIRLSCCGNYRVLMIIAAHVRQASIWNMHRDPKVFANPNCYDPDRFFNPTQDHRLPPGSSITDGLWAFG